MSTLLVTPARPKVKPLKVVVAALMLAVGVSILAYGMSDSEAAKRDYLCYWAAGQQLVHHQNPYDGEAILRLQKSVGFTADHPFYMRNPPTAFVIAYPLGFLQPRTGIILWSIALVAALMASVRMLWILNGKPKDRLHLVSYLFPPALACLLAGQMGIFLLLGIALFLRLRDSKPYWAGLGLFVIALKPHLFLPFAIALLFSRAYKPIASALCIIGFSLGLAWALDPSCLSHYSAMVRAENIGGEFIPTISFVFRMIVAQNHPWIQFVPAIVACVWAVRQRDPYLLLLVSIMVAPYAWFTDEAIVLPAILFGLYHSSKRSMIAYCVIAGIALIEVFCNVRINYGGYIWTAPAWLLWYINRSPVQPQKN